MIQPFFFDVQLLATTNSKDPATAEIDREILTDTQPV
jgi:hypothetical protein